MQSPADFLASAQGTKNEIERAIIIALNRTADGTRAEAVRKIRATHNVQMRIARAAFSISRAYRGKPRSVVYGSGRPLNVIGFGARSPTKTAKRFMPKGTTGVSVDIKGTRKVIPGTFIATLPGTGYRGVFRRKGAGRFPIQGVTTVAVPSLFKRDITSGAIPRFAQARFQSEFRSALAHILSKRTAG